MMWLIRFIGFFVVLGWSYALFRTIRSWKKNKWLLGRSGTAGSTGTKVSIIIPARNEESSLWDCLQSARDQLHENIEIIVLDDASEDGTPEIIQQHASEDDRILALLGDGAPLPADWFGKPWALQRAQKKATGEWLAFIDADVQLAPEAISTALGYVESQELDMLTGVGDLTVDTFWERVLQPAVGGLILAGNSLSEVNDPNKKDKNLANGQFIFVSRKSYDEIGQHNCVQRNILDDVGIARALVASNKNYHCLFLHELFSCRMYTSLGEIWEGWSKNLFAGLRYSWPNLAMALFFTFAFSVLGQLLLLLGIMNIVSTETLLWGLAMTLSCQSLRLAMDIRRKQPIVYGLSHSIANIMVMGILINSALSTFRGTVRWKGRIYQPEE
jgi:chlorobactene glucosyltransferase